MASLCPIDPISARQIQAYAYTNTQICKYMLRRGIQTCKGKSTILHGNSLPAIELRPIFYVHKKLRCKISSSLVSQGAKLLIEICLVVWIRCPRMGREIICWCRNLNSQIQFGNWIWPSLLRGAGELVCGNNGPILTSPFFNWSSSPSSRS